MTTVQDTRRVITAREAERELGIPASSIRAWASGLQPKLHAVSIGPDRQRWYRLEDVLELAVRTKRRTPHTRTRRRS